jgi:thiamine-phosphate pyrophosphorylase
MDHRLVAWARGVKARRRRAGGRAGRVPALWLFTDEARLPDPCGAVKALPRGLCGVVFRHDGVPGRAALARALARQCRQRAIPFVVAGDARLAAAVGAGVHLRGAHPADGRLRMVRAAKGWRRLGAVTTSSAHSAAELRRAWKAGADAVFLSPALPTRSHPGAPALGVVRWAALSARLPHGGGTAVLALGGVDGRQVRRLPRWCGGAGAIGALLPDGGNKGCVSAVTVFRNCHKSFIPGIAAIGQPGNSVNGSGCTRP